MIWLVSLLIYIAMNNQLRVRLYKKNISRTILKAIIPILMLIFLLSDNYRSN